MSDEGKRAKKRARFDDDANQVVEFNHENPASVTSAAAIDLRPIVANERREEVKKKLELQQLSPEKTGRLSNNQQAFNVFQIPFVVDSKLLTVKELQSELRVRGLKLCGTKEQLVRRLDKFIQENESKRVRE